MAISTTDNKATDKTIKKRTNTLLPNILTTLIALLIFGIGVWMRLRDLGLPIDRDGYDEGVYWQSLRAMGSGYHLYQQVFYSQPPFFLLSIFPTYMLFGQTLWAARLGIALVSLLGLLGAFLLGYALSGRIGALVALLLLVIDPLYLQQSQTLQAEAPFVAFSLLAVGTAYLWWRHPSGVRGICYAALAGTTLSLSIFCKLFGLAAFAPIGLLFLAHIWRIFQQEPKMRLSALRSLLVGVTSFVLISIVLIVPFTSSFHQLVQGVISFHTQAGKIYYYTQASNLSQIKHALTSLLALAALYGTIVTLVRRDWRVLPLLTWFGATAALLWQQAPLFPHHEVAFVAPLLALAVMGISPYSIDTQKIRTLLYTGATVVTLLTVLLLSIVNLTAIQHYYRNERNISTNISFAKWDVNVERDVQSVTPSHQLVITDAQFLVALANRNTDPLLVDTSTVRVTTGYLTPQQLVTEAQKPSVHTVLFYTGRLLHMKNIGLFYSWLKQHFRLVHNYAPGKELWVKV